jgi:hypothetical protein
MSHLAVIGCQPIQLKSLVLKDGLPVTVVSLTVASHITQMSEPQPEDSSRSQDVMSMAGQQQRWSTQLSDSLDLFQVSIDICHGINLLAYFLLGCRCWSCST